MAVCPASSNAVIGDVYTDGDFVDTDSCFSKKYRNADAYLEITNSSGQWRKAVRPYSTRRWSNGKSSLNKRGCAAIRLEPAGFANVEDAQVAYRVRIPKQKLKGRVVPARTKHLGNFKVWKKPLTNRSVPTPHLGAFAATYGDVIATILCQNRNGGVAQGTGVSVPINLSAEARQYGNTYLATAGHVIEGCRYAGNRSVIVVYKGISYPGRMWNYSSDPDLGSVVTTAPVPTATVVSTRIFNDLIPQIGDVGIAIGAAGGVVGTTTQGLIVGVSDSILNTTIPSGPGASGGPVFNNEGWMIGFVTAGSGSLTELAALPAMCGTVFVAPCSATWAAF